MLVVQFSLIACLFLVVIVLIIKLRQLIKNATSLECRLTQTETLFQAEIANLKSQLETQNQGLSQLPKIIDQQGQQQHKFDELIKFGDSLLSQVQQLENSVQLLESQNIEDKMYVRAKKLIELGADLDEVVTECGISKSEAALLASLSRQS